MKIEICPQKVCVGFCPPVVRDYRDIDPYTGDYEATPTLETQIFQTENKRMTDNFIVNPIPSYYGLITWDGSILIVS